MNIPDEAVYAATSAVYRKHGEPVDEESVKRAMTTLEHGAPLIVAEFLRGVIAGMPADHTFNVALIAQAVDVLEGK